MNTDNSKSALEVIQQPTKIRKILEENNSQTSLVFKTIPSNFDAEMANDLVLTIAEGTGQENARFAQVYEAVKIKNKAVDRDMTTALEYAGKAYQFVSDHWGEIFFILMLLNNKGYFDKLKKKPKFKVFLATLFEEKVKTEEK